MQIMRNYSEVDMYLGLELQTDERMKDGEHKQQAMGTYMQVSCIVVSFNSSSLIASQQYQEKTASDPDAKNWNFPKCHTHIHAFNDIRKKGVTRNYNTKPNEKLHGPLKDTYRLRTNFKNVAQQVFTPSLCLLCS